MFAGGGDLQIEISEYNTAAIAFLQNLGIFTNSLKNDVNFPEVTNNFPSFL